MRGECDGQGHTPAMAINWPNSNIGPSRGSAQLTSSVSFLTGLRGSQRKKGLNKRRQDLPSVCRANLAESTRIVQNGHRQEAQFYSTGIFLGEGEAEGLVSHRLEDRMT